MQCLELKIQEQKEELKLKYSRSKKLFGNEFVDHFAASREWEEREYRKHVSDWEMDRYFEII